MMKTNYVVLDTNVVLDLLLFNNEKVQTISQQLAAQQVNWVTTLAMEEELLRVLSYPNITKLLVKYNLTVEQIMTRFQNLATIVAPVPNSNYLCRDPDDQKFIDLAVAYKAILYSKDKAVLKLKKKLNVIQIPVEKL